MIKLMIPWLLFPYLIEWFNGNFAKAALAVSFLYVLSCVTTTFERASSLSARWLLVCSGWHWCRCIGQGSLRSKTSNSCYMAC